MRTSLLIALVLSSVAWPCAGPPDVSDVTTFDPHVLEPTFALDYDPNAFGYSSGTDQTVDREAVADWAAWFGPSVKSADWERVRLTASLPDLDGLIDFLRQKQPRAPTGFEWSSVAMVKGPLVDKMVSALFFVGFARRVDPLSMRRTDLWGDPIAGAPPKPAAADAQALQTRGDAALARATDPFLKQRYAFALLRLRFYRKDFAAVLAFAAANALVLEGPSPSLKWRAKEYVAGALRRSGRLAESNLAFAHIADQWPALAPRAAFEFAPVAERDWHEALALATTPDEKALLWQLAGLRGDGLTSMKQIIAVDARSNRLALLAAREIARLELTSGSFAPLEAVAVELANRPTTARRWFFQLLAGHLAARRGDAKAQALLSAALEARPADPRVHAQASASLAMLLARSCAPDPERQNAFAAAMHEVRSPTFTRAASVLGIVRETAATSCAKAGRTHEAALLGVIDEPDAGVNVPALRSLITDLTRPSTTPYDRALLELAPWNVETLERTVAFEPLSRGQSSTHAFTEQSLPDAPLGADPFALHLRDCHDCDHASERCRVRGGKDCTALVSLPLHATLSKRKEWTTRALLEQLDTLTAEAEAATPKSAERAAEASYLLGAAFYNLTWFGNLRALLEGTRGLKLDPAISQRWHERAFSLTTNREAKARYAYAAAKSELATKLPVNGWEPMEQLPIPARWFPALEALRDTKYHAEVLAECGTYRAWYATKRH